MPYDELAGRLRDDFDPVTVGAFPDGSVDDFYRLRDGDAPVTSRAAFATAVADGRDSFRLEHVQTAPGGQAVNMARQAAALGDDVSLVGHLDHPIFGFDFETASMGDPARVSVHLFDADDMLFVEESADLDGWEFADLRAATAGRTAAFLERDALCCGNWASVPGLSAAFGELAEMDPDGGVFCLDPGPLTAVSDDRVAPLLAGLRRLRDAYDVVVSVNGDEAVRLADDAGHDGADPLDPDALAAVRDAAGVHGVVVHGDRRAVAATADGTRSVPALDVRRTTTETGAGDRFSAGLARALAADWGWDVALALGNACAAYYVSTERTADVEGLRAHLREHGPK